MASIHMWYGLVLWPMNRDLQESRLVQGFDVASIWRRNWRRGTRRIEIRPNTLRFSDSVAYIIE